MHAREMFERGFSDANQKGHCMKSLPENRMI